ncbi:MAG: hypothetical protein COA99_06775 [Moraxellaceae bacterium]|nr:MAG: hypothetical protein COA99_06775 [Moraxellaceae bacterium]
MDSSFDYTQWANTPQQSRSMESLNQLLDATERLLNEDDIANINVQKISAEAGLTVGALYRRFSSKEDLLHALHERFAERMEVLLKTLSQTAKDQKFTARQIVRLFSQQAWGFAAEQKAFLKLTNAFSAVDSKFSERSNRLRTISFELLMPIIMSTSAEFTHPEPEKAVRFFLEMSIATTQFRLESGYKNEYMLEEKDFLEQLELSFINYLGVKPES